MAGGRGGRSFAAMITTVPLPLRAAQALLGLLGAVVLFASIYFSVVAPPEPVDGLDWLVAAWAFATGAAALAIAPRLARGGDTVRLAATALVANHFVFGLVKLVAYGESAAVPFMAIDLALLALLSARGIRSAHERT
jgi:hypothetical protein